MVDVSALVVTSISIPLSVIVPLEAEPTISLPETVFSLTKAFTPVSSDLLLMAAALEIALAGFKKKEVKVYTEHGKLIVEGKKEEKKENEYVHRGMAQRPFQSGWQLTDDVEIKEVIFEDGLLSIHLGKIVPEHHARKDYL